MQTTITSDMGLDTQASDSCLDGVRITRCTLCKTAYSDEGQQTGPIWMMWGPSFHICKRCYNAGMEAKRRDR